MGLIIHGPEREGIVLETDYTDPKERVLFSVYLLTLTFDFDGLTDSFLVE